MKKLFTFVALAASMFCASATPVTDTFSYDNLTDQLGYKNWENWDATYTGESGAKYYVDNVCSYGNGKYAMGKIYVTEPAADCEISAVIAYPYVNYSIYLSDTELTPDNYTSGSKVDASQNWFGDPISVAGKGYKYAYIEVESSGVDSQFPGLTWDETVETPDPVEGDGDVITAAKLLEANPDATVTHFDGQVSTYDSDWKLGNDLVYETPDGTLYILTNVGICDTEYRFPWNWNLSSNLSGQNVDKWIESVEIRCSGIGQQDVQFYASEDWFDVDDRNDADFKYKEYANSPIVINVNVPCTFFMMTVSQGNIESITVNWTDEKPVPTVVTPVINCYDDPAEVGSDLAIKTATVGATIHTTVFINDELAETQPEPFLQEQDYYTMYYSLPGKAGDKIRVEAYATKEGWVDSETAEWECESLAMSPAPHARFTVDGSSYVYDVFYGTEVTVSVATYDRENDEYVDIEGAEVSIGYEWVDYKTPYPYERGSVDFGDYVAAPATFVIPDDIPIGTSLELKAYSKAPGYRESNGYSSTSYTVLSKVLNPPTFNYKDGDIVKAGGTLNINKANNATEIHYTVNGGEEQVSTEWSVSIPVTVTTTVEAWSTGDEPFEPSEKVTVTVSPEHFEAWQDVITPSTFGMATENNTSMKVYNSELTNETTGVEYEYRGKFYDRYVDGEYVNAFYMDGANWQDYCYVRNTTTAYNDAAIKTVQIDPYNNQAFFVFLSKDPITITSEMTNYDYADSDPIRLSVAPEGDVAADYADNFGLRPNKMIDLDQLQDEQGDDEFVFNDNTYIAIVPRMASQSYYLLRAIVGYDKDKLSGIENVTVDSLNGVDAVYNLNGVKVDADKLNPGVYVRVANGKANKVIVK